MKKAVLGLIILFMISSVLAIPTPTLPNVFSGEVSYFNGNLDLEGVEISASMGGEGLGVVGEVLLGNSYKVAIEPRGKTGEIIFYVGGVEAEPKAEYNMGKFSDLNLFIDEIPENGNLCGNGVIDLGEECDGLNLGGRTCGSGWTGQVKCTSECKINYSDCGLDNNQNSNPDSSSSNSGSSSSSSSSSNRNSNSLQTNSNNTINLSREDEEPEEQDNITLTGNQDEQKGSPGITGAVIGALGSVGIVLAFVFIVGIVVLAIVVAVVRKRKFGRV